MRIRKVVFLLDGKFGLFCLQKSGTRTWFSFHVTNLNAFVQT